MYACISAAASNFVFAAEGGRKQFIIYEIF